MSNLKKILLLCISSISFIFGGTSLLENTDDIVEIHESHKILQDENKP